MSAVIDSNARRLAVAAGIVAAGFARSAARADFIVDQQPTADIGLISTLYALDAPFSTLEIDSFTTQPPIELRHANRLHSATMRPQHFGDGFDLSSGPPGGPSANLVATASGTLDADRNIVVRLPRRASAGGLIDLTAFPERQNPLYGIRSGIRRSRRPQALTWPSKKVSPAPETSTLTDQTVALCLQLT